MTEEKILNRFKELNITEEELSVLERELNSFRTRMKIFKEKEAKQQACNHDKWFYSGRGHNDDCYECSNCGLTKWV